MMTMPVLVEEKDGAFVASVLGSPELCATSGTRELAVATLRVDLAGRVARGELAFVDVEPTGILATVGRQRTAEEIEEMDRQLAEIYRERDELKRQEFPE